MTCLAALRAIRQDQARSAPLLVVLGLGVPRATAGLGAAQAPGAATPGS